MAAVRPIGPARPTPRPPLTGGGHIPVDLPVPVTPGWPHPRPPHPRPFPPPKPKGGPGGHGWRPGWHGDPRWQPPNR